VADPKRELWVVESPHDGLIGFAHPQEGAAQLCYAKNETVHRYVPEQQAIPCAKRLPSLSEYVWCWVRSGPDLRWVEGQCFGHYWEVYRFGVVVTEQVTHWMPKPPAPEMDLG
jgi:hypothetical protein